jgi:hypothetical protein
MLLLHVIGRGKNRHGLQRDHRLTSGLSETSQRHLSQLLHLSSIIHHAEDPRFGISVGAHHRCTAVSYMEEKKIKVKANWLARDIPCTRLPKSIQPGLSRAPNAGINAVSMYQSPSCSLRSRRGLNRPLTPLRRRYHACASWRLGTFCTWWCSLAWCLDEE